METNDAADSWANEIAERIGVGVRLRRVELGLSAQGVADRTVEIGFPITRGTVSKIENNNRRGKIEVIELLTLAKALQTSPVALLWHDAADAPANVFPYVEGSAGLGLEWTTGDRAILTGHGWDDSEEADRQAARLRALRRLSDSRMAVARASQRRHPSRGESREHIDATALLADLARAEEDAVAHGWRVRRG